MTRIYEYSGQKLNYRDSQKIAKKLQRRSGISDKQRRKLKLKHVGWKYLIMAINYYDKRIDTFIALSESQRKVIAKDAPILATAIENFMVTAMELELDMQSLSEDLSKPKYTTDGNLIILNQES